MRAILFLCNNFFWVSCFITILFLLWEGRKDCFMFYILFLHLFYSFMASRTKGLLFSIAFLKYFFLSLFSFLSSLSTLVLYKFVYIQMLYFPDMKYVFVYYHLVVVVFLFRCYFLTSNLLCGCCTSIWV